MDKKKSSKNKNSEKPTQEVIKAYKEMFLYSMYKHGLKGKTYTPFDLISYIYNKLLEADFENVKIKESFILDIIQMYESKLIRENCLHEIIKFIIKLDTVENISEIKDVEKLDHPFKKLIYKKPINKCLVIFEILNNKRRLIRLIHEKEIEGAINEIMYLQEILAKEIKEWEIQSD